ncbi:hypothetical protein GQ44DRAFT_827244 [Phaeosphaeriaceae sp. PMI808]|nr:hypothetical protein GQ44DRAFT_827244 [Phaeosphaeriaceae sp. PMI808]
MSANSPIFLEVDEFEREPNVRRAGSNGYLDERSNDFLKDQERWERRDREFQMIRYRDRGDYGASHQRTSSDRLAVPVYEVNPRRVRSHSNPGDQDSRAFRTPEVRPGPVPVRRRENLSDTVYQNVLQGGLEREERGSNRTKQANQVRPKIKVNIIQEHPPVFRPKDRAPGKSPSASPRSPSGQPQLQLKYIQLQNWFADINLTCLRYADVEAANPRDLSFAKISEQVRGFEFDLKAWSHVANIQNMAKSEVPRDAIGVTDAAARNMDRLIDRAMELNEACSKAKPNDLKFRGLAKIDDEESIFDSNNDDQEQDLTESLGYIIDSGLHSIKLQIQNLKRLTRSLQEATPDARDEVVAVASLVKETEKYFGSEEALNRYCVDRKYGGRRALEEARLTTTR